MSEKKSVENTEPCHAPRRLTKDEYDAACRAENNRRYQEEYEDRMWERCGGKANEDPMSKVY